MTLNNHGFIGRLLMLALLGAAMCYTIMRWWPSHSLVRVGGELETAVNRQLVDVGIHDSLIVSQLRHEHSRFGIAWIETERDIVVDNPAIASTLIDRLTRVAHHFYLMASKTDRAASETIDIGLGPLRFQRLVLLKHPQAPVAGQPVQPEVAFVIDDVANDPTPMDRFAALGVPLTFAILPRDRHCKDLADKAQRMNFGVILHLPMEPIDLAHNDPGSAGLYLKMTPEQLHSQFERDVASVPHIEGINNHMGSAFTENESKMAIVMPWVKEKHLFFLDSRTSNKSVVCRVAKRFGVPCHINETFLDNKDEVADIEHQLDLVLKLAIRNHRTVAIGHYRRKHLVEALANKIPEFRAHGVQLVILPTFYR